MEWYVRSSSVRESCIAPQLQEKGVYPAAHTHVRTLHVRNKRENAVSHLKSASRYGA